MLSRFRMTNQEIKRAIETMDPEVLTPDNVQALSQFVPTAEEVHRLLHTVTY